MCFNRTATEHYAQLLRKPGICRLLGVAGGGGGGGGGSFPPNPPASPKKFWKKLYTIISGAKYINHSFRATLIAQ